MNTFTVSVVVPGLHNEATLHHRRASKLCALTVLIHQYVNFCQLRFRYAFQELQGAFVPYKQLLSTAPRRLRQTEKQSGEQAKCSEQRSRGTVTWRLAGELSPNRREELLCQGAGLFFFFQHRIALSSIESANQR